MGTLSLGHVRVLKCNVLFKICLFQYFSRRGGGGGGKKLLNLIGETTLQMQNYADFREVFRSRELR